MESKEQSFNEEELAKLDELSKKATDIEVVLFFVQHIDHPCQTKEGFHIREFYLREAEKISEKLTNPFAQELLRKKIEEYRNKKDD